MSRNRSSNNRQPAFPSKREKRKQQLIMEQRENTFVKREPDVKKKFTQHDINPVKPLTESQLTVFQEWGQGQQLVLRGFPGTGKTFLSMYLALNSVLDPDTPYEKIVIVRSPMQSGVNIGFTPGTVEEKLGMYEKPYIQICDYLFKWKNSYANLKEIGVIEFESTAFLRGCSWDNAIIIFDEFQNADEVTLTTVCTRVGQDSRLIICGDTVSQNDMGSKSGGDGLLKVLDRIDEVSTISFQPEDCVRSGFVKKFLIAKYR